MPITPAISDAILPLLLILGLMPNFLLNAQSYLSLDEPLRLPPTAMQKIEISAADSLNNPTILLANQDLRIAETARRLVGQEQLPDVWARLFSQRLYLNCQQLFTGFSVSLNLPLLSRPLQQTKTAALKVQRQRLQTEATHAQRQQRSYEAKVKIAQQALQLAYFEQTALPQAAEIKAAARLAYTSGEISYAELAQYLAQIADTEENYCATLLKYNLAAID